jgi:hypothetical protein
MSGKVRTYTQGLVDGLGNPLPLRVGEGKDYTLFDVDGSMRRFGEATVWDDIVQSVSATNLYGTPGKADYDFDNLWVVLEESGALATPGDCLFINYQISHAAKPDSTFRLHMHWAQSSDTVRTITGKYRVQDNGAGTTTAWTSFTATTEYGETGGNVFDTSEWDYDTDGNFNQITRLVDIPLTGLGVSAIIQVVFTRTDANATSDVYIYSVDGHIEKDDDGSRQEYIK